METQDGYRVDWYSISGTVCHSILQLKKSTPTTVENIFIFVFFILISAHDQLMIKIMNLLYKNQLVSYR